MVSLANSLAQIDRDLPAELVSAGARARLAAAAAHLPAPISRWIYLERRLRAGADRTDLIVGLERAGQEILAGANPAITVPLVRAGGPLWQRLGALCRARQARRLPGVTFIWLEFDLHEPGRALPPTPGIFLDLADPVSAEPTRLAHLIDDALRCLGHAAQRPLRESLARCLARRPRAAAMPTFGLFPARDPSALRICLTGVPIPILPDYLAAVGWPASAARLRRALAALACAAPAPPARLLHLDLGPALQPAIGIEFAFDRAAQLRGGLPERGFLDRLVRLGLCSTDERAALLRWPGCAVTTFDHELWPSLLVRRLHHIKVGIHPDGHLEAKAYLCFHHRYRPRVTR